MYACVVSAKVSGHLSLWFSCHCKNKFVVLAKYLVSYYNCETVQIL